MRPWKNSCSPRTSRRPWRNFSKGSPTLNARQGAFALKSIRPKEAAALRDVLPQLKHLAGYIAQYKSPILAPLADALALSDDVYLKLQGTLLEEPATFLREGDVVRNEADPELADLRNIRDNNTDQLTAMEARERDRTGITTLKIAYNRVSGFYIEIPKSQAGNVPVDYKRRQTLKNNERFITPELKEYEDRAFSAKERCAQIEKRIWDELVDFLGNWVEAILTAARATATLDVLTSFARYARDMRWSRPTMSATPGLTMTGVRHPVVEKMIPDFIPEQLPFGTGTAPSRHHGAQHGRQIHLHALGGARDASCLRRQLRSGNDGGNRSRRPNSYPHRRVG